MRLENPSLCLTDLWGPLPQHAAPNRHFIMVWEPHMVNFIRDKLALEAKGIMDCIVPLRPQVYAHRNFSMWPYLEKGYLQIELG